MVEKKGRLQKNRKETKNTNLFSLNKFIVSKRSFQNQKEEAKINKIPRLLPQVYAFLNNIEWDIYFSTFVLTVTFDSFV